MSELSRYRIRCLTESAYVYSWDNVEPTVCPNDAGHNIDSTTIVIVETKHSTYQVTAMESIGDRKAVYISGSDEIKLAKADNENTIPCVGFSINSADSSQTVTVQTNDELDGFTGLVPGDEYFLSQATAGEITNTKPESGIIVSVGVAKTTTQLDIHIFRRSDSLVFSWYAYNEVVTESSTTATTWQEKLDINVVGIPAGNYRIGWSFEWAYSTYNNPGANFGVHLDWGAITACEIEIMPSRFGTYGSGAYGLESGFWHGALTAGNHKIALNFMSGDSGQTAYIRRARLEIWRIG